MLGLFPDRGIHAEPAAQCEIPTEFEYTHAASTPEKNQITLVVDTVASPIAEAWGAKSPAATEPKNGAGFYYIVPDPADVGVTGPNGTQVAKSRFLVPQLGDVQSIPRVKGSNPKLTVDLYPDTGALKAVTIVVNSPDVAAMVGSAGTSTTTILNAVAARRKADQAADEALAVKNSPLALLQHEKALLEAELAILTAKDALAQKRAIGN